MVLVRRKKNLLFFLMGLATIYLIFQVTFFGDKYMPLRPLANAEAEAKRLLRFLTQYNYLCNNTVQVGNRSHWHICVEKDIGVDLESKHPKRIYSIGPSRDYFFERALALNYSTEVFIISGESVPYEIRHMNHTHAFKTDIVPNDPADFSRNSYGQQTANNFMLSLQHKHIDILKIEYTAEKAPLWEILHFMTLDNLLLKVHQLHIALYIDSVDNDDYLYNCYRALYDLFYRSGLRLYHTAASDSLCLQVTMMASCTYYLSFIKNPGDRLFVMHPPADFGEQEQEEDRLLSYMSEAQVECHRKQSVDEAAMEDEVHYSGGEASQWTVCEDDKYGLHKNPCNVVMFGSKKDAYMEKFMIQSHCTIHSLIPEVHDKGQIKTFWSYSSRYKKRNERKVKVKLGIPEMLSLLERQRSINLLELNLDGQEWEVLAMLLDSGVLQSVQQIMLKAQLVDPHYGRHPTALRRRYSELRRLQSQAFKIFSFEPTVDLNFIDRFKQSTEFHNIGSFRLGLVRTRTDKDVR